MGRELGKCYATVRWVVLCILLALSVQVNSYGDVDYFRDFAGLLPNIRMNEPRSFAINNCIIYLQGQ